MDEVTFIQKLKINNPTYDYFLMKGKNIEVIKNIFEPTQIKFKSEFTDPLLRLNDMYEFSPSYLTNLDLDYPIEEQFGQRVIGKLEGDFILMDRIKFNIYVVNYYNPREVIYHCAKNGSCFLDALYIRLSSGIPDSEDELEIHKFRQDVTNRCAIAVGSIKYKSFWEEV